MAIFINWIFFILLVQKQIKSHKEVCKNISFCGIAMTSEDTKILKFNQHQKSDKISIIYASLIRKVHGYKNNPTVLSTTKIGEQIPCGSLMSTMWTFDVIENKPK